MLAAAVPRVAVAQTVQVRDAVGGENAEGVPGWFFLTGTGSYTQGTNGQNEFFRELHTGTFDYEIDFGLGAGWEDFLTYCIELSQGIVLGINSEDNAGGLPFQIAPMSLLVDIDADEKLALETLWANAFPDSTTSRVKAAAFQSLIWELANDEAFDLSSGNFMLDDRDSHTFDVLNQANLWFTNSQDGTWTSRTELMLLTNPDSQDLIIPIPEPATLGLLILGAGAALRRRRAA